jgi:hypothetical protein
LILALALTLQAQPSVVIFGGGWGSEGTQVSIESHVARLAEVLAPAKPAVLFGGDAGVRSVQVAAEQRRVDAILGLVFDRKDHLEVTYRPKKVPSGKASKAALLAALSAGAGAPGMVVLGAGHGAPASEDQPAALELWGPDDRLSVTELAAHLDEHAKGPVAFVLGHCHSGAFADVMYRGGKPGVVASPIRCVLAAVPADREAAGCTPDIDDPSAHAYMALIAEALGGKSADFDADGGVSLAEAHAYARIHDDTVDVPVASSELFLMARLGDRLPAAEKAPIPLAARKPERAFLEGSAGGPQVSLGKLGKTRTIAGELDDVGGEIEEENEKLNEVLDRRDLARRRLADAVLSRWPELVNPYHHEARRLLSGDAAEVVAFTEADPDYRELLRLDEEIGARDAQILALERKAARLERFLRSVRAIAGERLLSRADRKTYESLLACEAMRPR